MKDIQTDPKKKKKDNMGMNNIKISLNMKNKGWLSTDKKYYKKRKNKDVSQYDWFIFYFG